MIKPKVEFLTGPAGTGKTYLLKERMKTRDPITRRHYGTLCATTGIAAVNLGEGVTTLNSELKFFDTASLEQNWLKGRLVKSLMKVMSKGANLCIDEVSMMEAKQLDIIYSALVEVNQFGGVQERGGLGLVLSGDFCQLAPVEGKYAFEADCWGEFAANTTKLTKVWRQDNFEFLTAINAAREGDGARCTEILEELHGQSSDGIFRSNLDLDYNGTTILPVNRDVDTFNQTHFCRLVREGNKKVIFKSFRWGVQRGEWKIIPESLELTENAYVMILANNPLGFDYANGDCGYLMEGNETGKTAWVKLKRNDKEVKVTCVCRRTTQTDTPDGMSEPENYLGKREYFASKSFNDDSSEAKNTLYEQYLQDLTRKNRKPIPSPFYDYSEEKWIMGEMIYVPLRLAYASTCHKCINPNSTILHREKGLIKAKDTIIGDYIYTGTQFNKIIGQGIANRRVYQLITKSGLILYGSSEHRIKTEYGFTSIEDLTKNDRVCTPLPNYLAPSTISDEMAYFLGLLIGDGNITDEMEGNLHFCNSNRFLQEKFVEYVRLQGYHANYRSDGYGAFCTSKPFRGYLHSLGLGYKLAASKYIPSSVLGTYATAPFLRGLYDTDGCINPDKNTIILTTASKIMAKEVQLSLYLLGIPCKRNEYPGVKKPYYQIRITSNGIEAFKNKIGVTKPEKVEHLRLTKVKRILNQFDGWDTVESVKYYPNNIDMIDFEIEGEEHTFWVNGIVTHNSQGLTLDSVQIDPHHKFFGQGSMMYVALSRVRSHKGLRIVGDGKLLENRVNIMEDVLRWI